MGGMRGVRTMRPVTTRTLNGPLMVGWCENKVLWKTNSLGDRSRKLSRLRIRRDTVQQRYTSHGHCNQEIQICLSYSCFQHFRGNNHDTKKTFIICWVPSFANVL